MGVPNVVATGVPVVVAVSVGVPVVVATGVGVATTIGPFNTCRASEPERGGSPVSVNVSVSVNVFPGLKGPVMTKVWRGENAPRRLTTGVPPAEDKTAVPTT